MNVCECGIVIRHPDLHFKSAPHIKFLKKIERDKQNVIDCKKIVERRENFSLKIKLFIENNEKKKFGKI